MKDAPTVAIHATRYDRDACEIGVAHLGYGAFHRAHQAVYLDDYMARTGDLGWGIAAINLRPSDSAGFAEAAAAQDGYLLKTTAPDGAREYRLVRSHLAHIDWAVDRAGAEAVLSHASVRAVTITVTESGYALDAAGALDATAPEIAAELKGGAPTSVYAYLARALAARAEVLNEPITIICCDNIRANGRMLERNLLTYLELAGRRGLADWVRVNAAFPCSMVDRITPRVAEELTAEVERLRPGCALAPVQCEEFTQWVLEDRFAGPMPNLGKVGVEVVQDVDPYEEAKIRILNGGHTCAAYLGALAGYEAFDQIMGDPALRAHFDAYQTEEVLPGLTRDLPFDKRAYRDRIAARFGNAAIADQLERICADGYAKVSLFIRPTLESCLAQGIEPRRGYDSVASWYVFARRASQGAGPIAYREPNSPLLRPLLARGAEADFARSRPLWADLPETYPGFAPGLMAAIESMEAAWPA